MICKARDVLVKHLPFNIAEEAHFCLPAAAASVTEWDDVTAILEAPYVSREDWSGAILESISLDISACAKNSDVETGNTVTVKEIMEIFPKIDLGQFNMNNWEDLIKSLQNVNAIRDGVIELKARQRPKKGKLSIGKKVRVQIILDGAILAGINEAGLKGPRGCGINANALLSLISSRLGNSQIVSKKYLASKDDAVDGVRDVLEANLENAGFDLVMFPTGKRKALETKIFGYLKSALKSPDIDAVALLSRNDHFEWRIEDLVDAGKPVLLLSSDGRSGNASCPGSRLAKAASEVLDLEQLAAKPRSRKRIENDLFSSRESGD